MRIKADDIKNGSYDGQYVWICDYRILAGNNKPLRRVHSQKVLVRNNLAVSKMTKTIYYSNSHFVGLNKDGSPGKSKIIPLFDNTGYRSNPGTPVNIFDNEAECKAVYRQQAADIIVMLSEEIKALQKKQKSIKEGV